MNHEKPIIFSTPMVQAILAGQKTQTRRVIKLGCQAFTTCEKTVTGQFLFKEADNFLYDVPKIPYQPGDVLWVRESYCPRYFDDGSAAYKADYDEKKIGDVVPTPKWRPSIHMPRAAARIFLRVTDVRAERLQEISEEDAEREGCMKVFRKTDGTVAIYARNSYAALWGNLNDKRGFPWKANPWVWVITFERVEA